MHTRRFCLGLVLFATVPVWSQVAPSATGAPVGSEDDVQMQTPPPVSSEPYPVAVGSESRSNYLHAALILNTAYENDVVGGGNAHPIGDVTYTIWPTIALDQTTSRQHRTFTYSPGFTFYQKTSELDTVDQNATLAFQYRLSQHAVIGLRDAFVKSSNILNQPYTLSGAGIVGSLQPAPASVVALFADEITNAANIDLSYQFARNSMIGAGGIFTQLHYPDPASTPGLSDSSSRGGAAFYSQRLSSTQYFGTTYQYLRSQFSPEEIQSETQTHTVLFFYTLYLKRTFSLSASIGPQYVKALQSLSPPYHSWVSAGTASIGWQASHVNLVASYLRTTTGGGGLNGVFNTKNASASATWKMTRTWAMESVAGYSINKNADLLSYSSSPGGHSISGTASVQHSVGEHIMAQLGYARMHQSYSGIAVISNSPDTDRVFVSLSYQFAKPLGR
jgi:hypothetical protein